MGDLGLWGRLGPVGWLYRGDGYRGSGRVLVRCQYRRALASGGLQSWDYRGRRGAVPHCRSSGKLPSRNHVCRLRVRFTRKCAGAGRPDHPAGCGLGGTGHFSRAKRGIRFPPAGKNSRRPGLGVRGRGQRNPQQSGIESLRPRQESAGSGHCQEGVGERQRGGARLQQHILRYPCSR